MNVELKNFYCLSINDIRYNFTKNIFVKYGLPSLIKYEGFNSNSFRNNELSCLFGHMSFTMIARYLNLPYYFFFEDDAYPRKDVKEKMEFYIANRPKNCGILVFGRNGEWGQIDNTYPNYHIVQQRPFGAHAYMVFKECYTDLIKSFESVKIADIALKGENFPNLKPYWTNEFLFIQKNMDSNCMSKRLVERHGNYFYPKEDGRQGLGIHTKLPFDPRWE